MNNDFSIKEKEIFKRVIKDYDELNTIIKFLVKNNFYFKDIKEFLEKLTSYGECNFRENEYLDFYYKDMLLTISNYKEEIYLTDDIDVYNDEETGYIGHFNNLREIKEIFKEDI